MNRFAELSAAQKAIEIVRWICALPAACCASLLPQLASALLRPPLMAEPPGIAPAGATTDFSLPLRQLVVLPLTGALFVLVGSLVAPRLRLYAAIVLTVLLTAEAFLSHVFVHLGRGRPNYGDFAAVAFAGLASTILIGYFERRRAESPAA